MGELLSPVEAILQNILGADNILVPPGSQVEEILQAIYYNTEYENNPESRVAEILLAIKNKGVYDGPVLSRMEDILVHKLNNIPYTKHKKEDLSRVEQLLLDWLEQGGGEEIIEYTGTFPMTILANGEPLLDYIISGNTVQNGTPTPDNPVMPQGTGDRTGNLINVPALSDVRWATQCPALLAAINSLPNGVYTMSISFELTSRNDTTDSSVCGWYIAKDSRILSNIRLSWETAQIGDVLTTVNTFTIDDNNRGAFTALYLYGCGINGVGATGSANAENIMLNTGSTALPYEPYGYKTPISSANTTTPVYLGEVETTRRIKKLVFDGSEPWMLSGNIVYINNTNTMKLSPLICTHFPNVQNTGMWNGNNWIFQVDISNLGMSGRDAWISYLQQQYAAGTPVTVWYVLANEETAVVNEPLMRIDDYADTLSMEQAGEDVPTNEKPTETVIDVPTSVKPSEGYIKYTEPTDGPMPKTQVLGTKNHEIYMTSNDEVYVLRR